MPCSRTTVYCQCHGDRFHELDSESDALPLGSLFILCLFVCLFELRFNVPVKS